MLCSCFSRSYLFVYDVIMYQTRKNVSHHLVKHRAREESSMHSGVFLKSFGMFGNVVKHGLECLMSSQSTLKLRREQRNKNIKKYMLIKIRYPDTVTVVILDDLRNNYHTNCTCVICKKIANDSLIYNVCE